MGNHAYPGRLISILPAIILLIAAFWYIDAYAISAEAVSSVVPVQTASLEEVPTAPQPGNSAPLHGLAVVWTLLGVFVGGLALNLTPCVYPLVPVTVSFFAGRAGESRGRLVVHGALYIGGLSATNSALGVAAAFTGSMLGAALQSPVVLAVVAGIMVLFATSLFGFWDLRLPQALTNAASQSYAGYFGTLFMGLTLGVVAAPCMGPFVIGLLTWVASLGSPWLGFLIFFTLSLGLGLPLFFLALFSGNLDRLPHSGEWMLWVRKLMGWVLVAMAAYFIRPLLPSPADTVLLAATALAAGLHLGWLDRTRAGFRAFGFVKTAAGVVALAGAGFLIGTSLAVVPASTAVTWQPYSDDIMEYAARNHRPVIVDFSAEWCTICHELDEITFRNPQVVKESAGNFVMLKVDLTNKPEPPLMELLKKHQIRGVPTVLFFDADGRERPDLRQLGFVPPAKFLEKMAALRKQTASGS